MFTFAVLVAWVPALLATPTAGFYFVWADEFNGTPLDATKWNIETGPRRQAINTASAVSVTNG
jgi:hypothetical protein